MMINQSSLKKQPVLKKAPHASSFLEQAKNMHPIFSPSSVKDHEEILMQEEEVVPSGVKMMLEIPRHFTTVRNKKTAINGHKDFINMAAKDTK